MPRHCKILYQFAVGCLLIRGAKTVIDALTIG